MRIRAMVILILFAAVLAPAKTVPSVVHADERTVENGEISVVDFEELTYPREARLSHIEGAVVIRVKLDAQGTVIRASAVSGAKLLIPPAVSNARKWRFRPSKSGDAVLIYDFRIEGLCHGYTSSQFIFRPPNFSTVTSCDAVVQP